MQGRILPEPTVERATLMLNRNDIEVAYMGTLSMVGTAKSRNQNKRACLEGKAGLYRIEGPNYARGYMQVSIIGAGSCQKPTMVVNEIAGCRLYTWRMMRLLRRLAFMEGCGFVEHETPDTRKRRILTRLGFVHVGEGRMLMEVTK